MTRRRKKKFYDGKEPAVRFELEDNAEELFLSHLEGAPVPEEKVQEAPEEAAPKDAAAGEETLELDLHGMTLAAAEKKVEEFLDRQLLTRRHPFLVKIITGKGLHSGVQGSVLPRHIHAFVCNRYSSEIIRIEEAPADVLLGGLPIRGHFLVKLKPVRN